MGQATVKHRLYALLPVAQADDQTARLVVNGVPVAHMWAIPLCVLPQPDAGQQTVEVAGIQARHSAGWDSL